MLSVMMSSLKRMEGIMQQYNTSKCQTSGSFKKNKPSRQISAFKSPLSFEAKDLLAPHAKNNNFL